MQRLAGLDAAFVYMETPAMHMHVCGTIILDTSSMPNGYSFEGFREVINSRLHLLAPFRRRLVQVPFQLHFPLWIEDPNFDLDNHVRRAVLPAPGGERELAELLGDLASRPLDRSRPLWELYVIEGLNDGHIAVFTKMHHSAIDGASGAEMMVHLFDLTPEGTGEHAAPTEEWQPEAEPSDFELVAGALAARARQPAKMAKLLFKSGRAVVDVARTALTGGSGASTAKPFTAPRTSFNGAITPRRSAAFGRASLDDMRFIKRTFGTTVNDVVLAATATSLRQWLATHGGVPDKPLVASVPISVRTEGDSSEAGNRLSTMFASLPVQLEDPVERLLAVAESTKGAKEVHGAIGADMLGDWAEFAMPALFGRVARLYSSMGLADRHPPIHNLVVSNIPGPPIPLYCAGARVVAVYPMGPILEGAGLNVTIISFMGSVDFSAIASRELVPDLAAIANGFVDAVAELKKAAEAKGAEAAAAATAKPAVKRARKAAGAKKTAATPAEPADAHSPT